MEISKLKSLDGEIEKRLSNLSKKLATKKLSNFKDEINGIEYDIDMIENGHGDLMWYPIVAGQKFKNRTYKSTDEALIDAIREAKKMAIKSGHVSR